MLPFKVAYLVYPVGLAGGFSDHLSRMWMKVLRTELRIQATDSIRCIYRRVDKGSFCKQGWPIGSRDIIFLIEFCLPEIVGLIVTSSPRGNAC
jgi:hypothetical protein